MYQERQDTSVYCLQDGQVQLSAVGQKIITSLDECFLQWCALENITEMLFPPLMTVRELSKLNYFKDHPDQGIFLSHLNTTGILPQDNNSIFAPDQLHAEQLIPEQYALTPAACYRIYLAHQDEFVDDLQSASTSMLCYRHQPPYNGLGRLFCFMQRKIVFIGHPAQVKPALLKLCTKVKDFAETLGISLGADKSCAPLLDTDPLEEKAVKLFLADEEYRYQGRLVVAHSNFHKQYFSRLCNTRTRDGRHAFAACLGLLHYAWLDMLLHHFNDETDKVLGALSDYCYNNDVINNKETVYAST